MTMRSLGWPLPTYDARPICASRRRSTAVELIITAALALSTAVAATAVSIGMARADMIGVVSRSDPSYAIVLLVAIMLATIATLGAVVAPRME